MATAVSAAAAAVLRESAGMTGQIVRWTKNSLYANKQAMEDASHRILAPPVLVLAKDVALRLQQQQARVEFLEGYMQKSLEGGGNQEQINPNVHNSGTDADKKIITPANSQPYWWKQMPDGHPIAISADDVNKRETVLEKARQNLHNLNILHQNTKEIARTFWHHLEHKTDPVLDKREQKWLKACFRQIRDRHAMTVENLAEVAITTRPYWDPASAAPMDTTMMNFLRGRLGVSLLCEHALAPQGLIHVDCHILTVLEEAISEAKLLCESYYSHMVTAAPEVVVVNQTENRCETFTIVPPFLHHAMVELLKNAMAASMERMTKEMEISSCSNVLPPTIYVIIHDHHDDDDTSYLSIDVVDQGGGFKNPELDKDTSILFEFVRTKKTVWDRLDDQQSYSETRSPMQGLGVGLCLSRIMMQHFGGDLELASHPPLLQQQSLEVDTLEPGVVASIKLLKNLDTPEPLLGLNEP
jgi:Histidine kinase-, DNA gyrase B-, and HSP90-like ATPase